MIICLCNPFSDKTRVRDAYAACTNGQSMQCGSCACEVKAHVDAHNNTLTVKALAETLPVMASAKTCTTETV